MNITDIYVNLPVKDVQKPENSGRSLAFLSMNSFQMRKQYA